MPHDSIVWVEPNFIITKEGKSRYQPIRQRDMVAVIPVADLRARLEGKLLNPQFTPEGAAAYYLSVLDTLLAELEK